MGDECEGRRQLFEHSRMEAVTSASTGSKHGASKSCLKRKVNVSAGAAASIVWASNRLEKPKFAIVRRSNHGQSRSPREETSSAQSGSQPPGGLLRAPRAALRRRKHPLHRTGHRRLAGRAQGSQRDARPTALTGGKRRRAKRTLGRDNHR